MNTTQRGLLLKNNQLKTDEGIILLCFYPDFNYQYYLHRYVYVGGNMIGSTLVVDEVILA